MLKHQRFRGLKIGNRQVQELLTDQPPSPQQMKSVRVFYNDQILAPTAIPRMLTDVPFIASDGDEFLISQRGFPMNLEKEDNAKSLLLTPSERRIARKKAVASLNYIFATGGVNQPVSFLNEALPVVIVSACPPLFNPSYADCSDFVAEPGFQGESCPVFPHYYPNFNGRQPSHTELQKAGVPVAIPLARDCFFNADAYFRGMVEDISLWLSAFDQMVGLLNEREMSVDEPCKPPLRGWLKATAVGLGPSHCTLPDPLGEFPLIRILMPLFTKALRYALDHGSYPHIEAIELPDFHCGKYRIVDDNQLLINKIRVVHSNRDVLDVRPEVDMHIVGLWCPSDTFAYPGNMLSYCGVQSMVGNNTDLRIVQSYVENPHVLELERYIPVKCVRVQ